MLGRMLRFARELPARFNQPLPVMMAQLTPAPGPPPRLPVEEIRALADAVAAWQLNSPVGRCLRRSLLRYYFLREAGLPVGIVYGARLKSRREGGGLGGHAWTTLNGRPFFEAPGDYHGFVPMFVYPPPDPHRPDFLIVS